MSRRNVLLVSFDDAVAPWPYRTAFREPLQLPNLEQLCEVATVFYAAYAQAPICGPSRASMMTSRLPHRLGILDNATFVFDQVRPEECWVHQLKMAGYHCSSGGKIHHMPTLRRPHHRELYSDRRKAFSSDSRLPRELRRRSISFGGHRNGRATPDGPDDAFYFDAQVAESAIEFLTEYDGSKPFYREVGFVSAHGPHLTPARFKRLYDADNFAKPEAWSGYLADNPYVVDTIPENENLRNETYWQQSVRNYFSSYSHGDHHLGRVLAALKASPHAQNTVVVVVSDHGFHLGNRNLLRKTTLWEQALHVPFVIFDPDHPVGQEVHDPVALVDLGHTVLDFAGVAMPDGRDGRSLRPMTAGARDADRVIPSYYQDGITIRKNGYRLIRYGDGSFQLFDLANDYWQLNDLGGAHPMFGTMLAALLEWARANSYHFSHGTAHSALGTSEVRA